MNLETPVARDLREAKGGRYFQTEGVVCCVQRSSKLGLITSIRFGEKVTDGLFRSLQQRAGSETSGTR